MAAPAPITSEISLRGADCDLRSSGASHPERYRLSVAKRRRSLVSVIVAAQYAPFRAGLKAALGSAFDVVAEAATLAELEARLRRTTADVLLLDAALSEEVVRDALRLPGRPGTVLVFTEVDDAGVVCEAFRLGASGFLVRDMPPDDVPKFVQAALAGEAVVAPALLRSLLRELCRSTGPVRGRDGGAVQLTAREREVATLLRRRYSTHRIAEELGISAITVRRHVSKLQQKLGVASRPDAVALLDE
jgi:DNA-binding NarL/FixJ family response regulator